MHIFPCSWALGTCKHIGIRKYFGSVTVESERGFLHFAFWRHRIRPVTFLIESEDCIFQGASFEPIKNRRTLIPEKLQGFHRTPLYHCYTLVPDRVAQNLEIISKNFQFSTRILMGFIIYYLVLLVSPMGRILFRWKSFWNNLEIQCHPIYNPERNWIFFEIISRFCATVPPVAGLNLLRHSYICIVDWNEVN